jgi:hypothetical protein
MKMNIMKSIPKNPYEILLIVLLIIFILSPIKISPKVANSVDSTLGIIFFSILIVYLFVYNHTILAILFVITVFELIRRSSKDREYGSLPPSVVSYTALQPTFSGQDEYVHDSVQYDQTIGVIPASNQDVMSASLQGSPGNIDGSKFNHDGQAEYLDYMADQIKRDNELMKTNTRLMELTLEEEVVHNVPSPRTDEDYLDSSYKPVYDNIHQATVV